jgi:hypothetical protein
MHLSAYNPIRGLAARAAWEHVEEPRRLRFTGGARWAMKVSHEALVGASPSGRERLAAMMLKTIADHRVGDRSGRIEPRKRLMEKRRPKSGINHQVIQKRF